MIYANRRLENDTTVLKVESRESVTYTLTIKNTFAKIEMTDAMVTQVLNIILRRTMDGLKMQQVGRNMYNPLNKVRKKSELVWILKSSPAGELAAVQGGAMARLHHVHPPA